MKEISLTKGEVTFVDDDDFEYLNQWKWHLHTAGYASRKPDKQIYMHRVITNAPDNMQVDHINGNRLDNRKENLRLVQHIQNLMNRVTDVNSAVQYKGVSIHKNSGLYRARIRKENIGYFKTAEEAALAYNEKAKELFGEYAKLNVIEAISV